MRRYITLLAFSLISRAALAQSDNPWAGPYAGLNVGAAHSSTCLTSSLRDAADLDSLTSFTNRYCPSGDFVGGLQVGENFQIKPFVWGIGADLDIWSAKNVQGSWTYTGAAAPPGKYSFSNKLNPSDFAVIGARVGYAGDLMLPI